MVMHLRSMSIAVFACVVVSVFLAPSTHAQMPGSLELPPLEDVVPSQPSAITEQLPASQEMLPSLADAEMDGKTTQVVPIQDSAQGAANSYSPESSRKAAPDGMPRWSGSLMFSDEDVRTLMAIYRDMLARQSGDESGTTTGSGMPKLDVDALRDRIGGKDEKEIPEEVLRVRFNSILYDGPNQWSIWLNGKRIARKEALEGFEVGSSQVKVIAASSRQVTYVWLPQPESFDKVKQRWEDRQLLGERALGNKAAIDQRIDFDAENRQVTFTLRPNQTFTSQQMIVLEGAAGGRSSTAATGTGAQNPASTGAVSDTEAMTMEDGSGMMHNPAMQMNNNAPSGHMAPVQPPAGQEPWGIGGGVPFR